MGQALDHAKCRLFAKPGEAAAAGRDDAVTREQFAALLVLSRGGIDCEGRRGVDFSFR
jgi:hypothetical protein